MHGWQTAKCLLWYLSTVCLPGVEQSAGMKCRRSVTSEGACGLDMLPALTWHSLVSHGWQLEVVAYAHDRVQHLIKGPAGIPKRICSLSCALLRVPCVDAWTTDLHPERASLIPVLLQVALFRIHEHPSSTEIC